MERKCICWIEINDTNEITLLNTRQCYEYNVVVDNNIKIFHQNMMKIGFWCV